MSNELLIKTCKYIQIRNNVSDIENTESRIAEKVLAGELTDDQLAFASDVLGDGIMAYVEKLTTPVSDKKFTFEYTAPSYNYPNPTPLDAHLYDYEYHWIYIHSEAKMRWGDSYWISNNCSSTLYGLPVIKAFKEFDFEVGHFYRVILTDCIEWGGNKKKYIFKIEECSEEEFMTKGFYSDAYDNGYWDKCYMEQMVNEYNSHR